MIGWMSPWDADDAVRLENGWAGMMATPRVLTIEDGRLIQKPIEGIDQLRQDKGEYIKEKVICNEGVSFDNISGQHFDLSFEVDISKANSFTIELAKGKNNATQLSYNVHRNEWIFDSNAIRKVQEDGPREKLEFRVLMDRYSIEIFADGGKRVFTALIDPDEDAREIVFLSEGKTALYNVEFYSLM
jgi:beta-fructofuranosidase